MTRPASPLVARLVLIHPGETKTISIAIYDRMQAFDTSAASTMAAALLACSLVAIAIAYSSSRSRERTLG